MALTWGCPCHQILHMERHSEAAMVVIAWNGHLTRVYVSRSNISALSLRQKGAV